MTLQGALGHEQRILLAEELGDFILQRTQPTTFKSRAEATAAASAACPELPWEKIFAALEAAGLVAFLGEK